MRSGESQAGKCELGSAMDAAVILLQTLTIPTSPRNTAMLNLRMDIEEQFKLASSYAVLVYEAAVKVILSIIIIVLLATMSWMVVKFVVELRGLLGGSVKALSKTVIVNVLLILATFEIFRTTMVYFSEGRVKVTYIVDTVLVVVLTEVMAFWFKDIEYRRLGMAIALVLTLIVARILAIRFSPDRSETAEERL